MLLTWLAGREGGQPRLLAAAKAIEEAVEATLATPPLRTADLGGPSGTKAFGEAVAARLGR
jgi:3-isopropylmalate dehydrogenase